MCSALVFRDFPLETRILYGFRDSCTVVGNCKLLRFLKDFRASNNYLDGIFRLIYVMFVSVCIQSTQSYVTEPVKGSDI